MDKEMDKRRAEKNLPSLAALINEPREEQACANRRRKCTFVIGSGSPFVELINLAALIQ